MVEVERRERAPPRALDGQERDAFVSVFFFVSRPPLSRFLAHRPSFPLSSFEHAFRSSIAPITRVLSRPRLRAQELAESERKHRTSRRNWIEENARLDFLLFASSFFSSPHRRRRRLAHLQHGRPGPGRGRAQRGGGGALLAGSAAHASSAKRRGHGCAKRGWGDRGERRRIKQSKREGKEWRVNEEERDWRPEKKRKKTQPRPLQIFFLFFLFIISFLRVLG